MSGSCLMEKFWCEFSSLKYVGIVLTCRNHSLKSPWFQRNLKCIRSLQTIPWITEKFFLSFSLLKRFQILFQMNLYSDKHSWQELYVHFKMNKFKFTTIPFKPLNNNWGQSPWIMRRKPINHHSFSRVNISFTNCADWRIHNSDWIEI